MASNRDTTNNEIKAFNFSTEVSQIINTMLNKTNMETNKGLIYLFCYTRFYLKKHLKRNYINFFANLLLFADNIFYRIF